MRPSFHPRLINGPFNDPGLFIPFVFQNRALIFDIGNINGLSAKDILKISHAFVTHAHMDHFIGFDHLLRVKANYLDGKPARRPAAREMIREIWPFLAILLMALLTMVVFPETVLWLPRRFGYAG